MMNFMWGNVLTVEETLMRMVRPSNSTIVIILQSAVKPVNRDRAMEVVKSFA